MSKNIQITPENPITSKISLPIQKYNSYNKKTPPEENKTSLIDSISDDRILSSIFFKKYKPIKLIGAGTFSVVYEGYNIQDKTKVALKIEQKKSKISLLKSEACNIFSLQGFGIVKFISFGHNKDFNILVEPLLGKTLYSLFLESKKNFTLKDICLISIQTLERIEHIHSKGYLHGDIKPENFLIGKKDPRIIYIIDFGLSKKYRSDRSGRHIQFCVTKKMTGTARYASTNNLRGVEISRRDDLESLAYMIIYFIMKKLPWQGIRANNLQNRYKKIYYMKKKLIEDEMFLKMPQEIQNFYKDIKKLKFEEEPNYNKLKEYFRELLIKNNLKEDNNFSWINTDILMNSKVETNLKERKSNSQKRLMDKLMQKKNPNYNNDNDNEIPIDKHKIKQYYSFKNSNNTNSGQKNKNIIYNECIYSTSNNKDIKSINEAIDIDVGDFSENEDEKSKNSYNLMKNKLKKYNSDIKVGDINIEKEDRKDNDDYLIKFNKKNNNNKKDILENNKNNLYNIEIKNYTSFNKKIKNENKINNNIQNRFNFQKFNIDKNYLINEMKSKKNIEKKINDENVNNDNITKDKSINNKINNYNDYKNIKKRSKSGEKCSIQ